LQLNEIVNPFVLVDTALSLTNSNVFSNSNIIIKDACSGAILGAEENEVLEFTLYPNPTSKTINIISEFKIDQIKMFDVTGLKILSKKQSSNFLQIDISEFKQGTYIIEIHSATKVLRKKLIIE
ncbi:MAG: T9SS type A sorting domain-containing protein, partial [Bacteroidota bacterium]